MTRDQLIERTLIALTRLPDSKVQEVADFADQFLRQIEDRQLIQGIQSIASKSKAFEFLAGEEDIYSVNDLKERYK
jgi:hypothetical protein